LKYMPKVSVIIPTYNRCNLLTEAIKSVLQQSYGDFEVLVIDDGSTDDTRLVVESISDDRIRYLYKDNGGQSSARNLGFVKAKSKYVAYLDSDDLWSSDYLETMVRQLDANEDYGAVYTRIISLHSDGRREELSKPEHYRSGWITKYFFDSMAYLAPLATCFRKSACEDIFWDEALRRDEDYDFFLRVSTKTQFLFVPDAYAIKRAHAGSFSSEVTPIGAIDGAHILERFYFHFGGDKYVSLRAARRKISHRYRKAAKIARALGNSDAAILLFKKAMSCYPTDIRLYLDLLRASLKSKQSDTLHDWQMPGPLPPYITVSQKL